jgi:hypothetical protein
MANNCLNELKISGHPFLMKEFMDSYTNEGHFDFAKITPMPSDEELLSMGTNSYNWAIENWGQKWYIDQADWEDWDDSFYSAVFDTAWGPCTPVILKLIELCPGLDFTFEYYEPGCAFLGWIYASGGEVYDDYEISYSESPEAYWYHMFDKEYESYDWLSEHVEDLFNDETITKAESDEVLQMIDDDTPLETLIARCIELEIL